VVLLNRVTEDASGNPDALTEARTTQLAERCRPLRYPDNFIKTIVEVIVVAAVPVTTVVPIDAVPVVPLGHKGRAGVIDALRPLQVLGLSLG
jgi:hypothetical protein